MNLDLQLPNEKVENIPKLQILGGENGACLLKLSGDFNIDTIANIYDTIENSNKYLTENNYYIKEVDVKDLLSFDTSGAFLISKLIEYGKMPNIIGKHASFERLLIEVDKYSETEFVEPVEIPPLELLGKRVVEAYKLFWSELVSSVSFLGATIEVLVKAIISPQKIRWTQTIAIAESSGLNAIPIVMILSFFIGAVISFMGAQTLRSFGATIFTVDLLGVSVLREFAVLITAIILAGRSDSAFTAQIGAMKMNQEIDAMSIMGLEAMEVLVLPRVLALLIMTPILVFFAMLAGLFGGFLVCVTTLDISFAMFMSRLQQHVGDTHFWTGMAKAPVFALIIAIIGCRKGLEVENDVISLGKNTTAAVVQAIFMVIVVDAIFALIYNELDI
ncbi:MAG: ABC transporter permease [Caulobacterales bacterium]|nr:ABC transporter permease [Caulobacterales bacterium]